MRCVKAYCRERHLQAFLKWAVMSAPEKTEFLEFQPQQTRLCFSPSTLKPPTLALHETQNSDVAAIV